MFGLYVYLVLKSSTGEVQAITPLVPVPRPDEWLQSCIRKGIRCKICTKSNMQIQTKNDMKGAAKSRRGTAFEWEVSDVGSIKSVVLDLFVVIKTT